jgi:RNA polymerase sigma-70 factor (ECF subfamily)
MTAAQESFYIQQFKLGDTSSFKILYEHYHKRMINYGKSLFPHYEDDVKDAFQDIFIALWKARERLSVDITLDFYLKRCIKNNLIHLIKKESKFDGIPKDFTETGYVIQDETNVLTSIIDAEVKSQQNKIYNQKLSRLTKRQRFLFTERFINEKSVEEIMHDHSLARQTVYNMIYRSINILKEA